MIEFPPISSGSKDYLKINEGQPVNVICRGTPLSFLVHWIEKKPIPCPSPDPCQFCELNKAPQVRFKINVVTTENGAFVAKILDQGVSVYNGLKELREQGYELDKYVVTISKRVNGGKTEYSVIPKKDGTVGPELLAQIKEIPLLPLQVNKPKDEMQTENPDVENFQTPDDNDNPFT